MERLRKTMKQNQEEYIGSAYLYILHNIVYLHWNATPV